MCADNKAVNKITVKYSFCISKIEDVLDKLEGAQVFIKLDLRSDYHHIRLRPRDEWKIIFKTQGSLYECQVMHFGFCNAFSTFTRFMNEILKLYRSVL